MDCTAGQMVELAGGPQAKKIGLPPLARVKGVDRQQQRHIINDDCLYVTYMQSKEFQTHTLNTNVFIDSYVTTGAVGRSRSVW